MQPTLLMLSLLAMILIALAVTKSAPSMTANVLRDNQARMTTLDGFRGLLAMAVLLHHCVVLQDSFVTGILQESESHITNFLGGGAVGFFFMISAYLFCGRLIRNDGRIDIGSFATGRVRRILPLYAVMVMVTLFVTIVEAGWTINVPVYRLIVDPVIWMLFDFVGRPNFNGVAGSAMYLGVVWTLKFEWILYFLLPVLALALRLTKSPLSMFVLLGLMTAMTPLAAFFVVGAAGYFLMRLDGPRWRIFWNGAAVAGIALCIHRYGSFNGPKQAILCAPLFVVVLQGTSPMVRWLSSTPMRFLGEISYSSYLIHVLVINMLGKYVVGSAAFAGFDGARLLVFSVATFALVTACSVMTFLRIERPYMTGTRKVAETATGQLRTA